MTAVDSSLAGIVVADTSIAWVDPVRGAFVRGYSLSDLAERCDYETVAYLVLEGELPTSEQAARFRETLAGASMDADREALARALGASLGCEAGLVAALPLAGETAPDRRAELAVILARLPSVAAAVRGAPAPPPGSYAARCLHALGASRADAEALRALEVLLSLEAEHGLSASTFACRVAASSGARPEVAMASATATLSGPRHGGATAAARAMLHEVASGADARALVAARRSKKTPLPGFGHRIYKGADPRLPPLRRAIDRMIGVPLRDAALAIEQAVTDEYSPKSLRANIDLWGAVALDALGVEPKMYVAAFALGVGSGWLAHYDEQAGEGRLIRPESGYRGPAERAVPLS